MTYTQSRFVVYALLVFILSLLRPKPDKTNKHILYFLGASILVDLLDQLVFSSNLELYVVYRLTSLFILIKLIKSSVKLSNWVYVIPALLIVFSFYFAITERNINYFYAPIIYVSKYGLINTTQYNFIMINYFLSITILMLYWMYHLISTEKHSSSYVKKHLLIVFTFLWTASIFSMYHIYIQLLFANISAYMKTAQLVMMVTFYAQNLFLLIALQWKVSR